MRIELLDGESVARVVGAAVVRADGLSFVLELGPADGPAKTRLRLSRDEMEALSRGLQLVVGGRPEAVILVDD